MDFRKKFKEQIENIQIGFENKIGNLEIVMEKIKLFWKYTNEYNQNIEYIIQFFPEYKENK